MDTRNIRHARVADNALMYGEKTSIFLGLINALDADLLPAGFVERTLVENMAVNLWRQWRARNVETLLLTHQMDEPMSIPARFDNNPGRHAFAIQHLADRSRVLTLLAREDSRCARNISEALRLLLELRKLRGPAALPAAAPPLGEQPTATPDDRTPEERSFDELMRTRLVPPA